MTRSRPAYIERKRALERAKRERRRNHPKPCDCWACITSARVEALLQERIRLQRMLDEGIDF